MSADLNSFAHFDKILKNIGAQNGVFLSQNNNIFVCNSFSYEFYKITKI
jgi:hypothetical protein